MEIRISKTTGSKFVKIRGIYHRSVATEISKPGVIKKYDQDDDGRLSRSEFEEYVIKARGESGLSEVEWARTCTLFSGAGEIPPLSPLPGL